MIRPIRKVLALTLAAAPLAMLPLPSPASLARDNPDAAAALLEKAIEAQGGRSLKGPITDVKVTADVTTYRDERRADLSVTEYLKMQGDREMFRSEMSLDLGEAPTIRLWDGSRAFQQKGNEVTALEGRAFERDRKELSTDVDFLKTCVKAFLLENLKGPGVRFEPLDPIEKDGRSAQRIRRVPPTRESSEGSESMTGALDRPLVIFIDSDGSHSLLGVELEGDSPPAPRRNLSFFGRLKDVRYGRDSVESLSIPAEIRLFSDNRIESKTYIKSLSLNEGLDDKLFRPK